MMKHKVSVIMSAYNSKDFIKEAIQSILSQTFTDFEFIIINDASTDSTGSIINSYTDPRIRIIDNEINSGLTQSLNIGLDEAHGEYIARMDADDISLPERLKKQVDFMENNPHIDVCGTYYNVFGSRNGVIKTPLMDMEIKDTLFFNDCIAHPSVIIKRDSLEKYGIRYDSNFRFAQDYELWCREANRLKFINIPEVLLEYRVHENQVGFAKKKEQDDYADKVKLKNINKIGIILSDDEQLIYLSILGHNYNFKSTEQLKKASEIFDKIGCAGKKNGYGNKFEEIIRGYMSNIAEKGLQLKKTSILLWFSVFRKWEIFRTTRMKIRYLYYSLRNILND